MIRLLEMMLHPQFDGDVSTDTAGDAGREGAMTDTDTQCRLPYVRDLTWMELTPQDRAALLVHIFQVGGHFSTAEIAQAFGMSTSGARRMLNRLSRVVPLVREDGPNSDWTLLKLDE